MNIDNLENLSYDEFLEFLEEYEEQVYSNRDDNSRLYWGIEEKIPYSSAYIRYLYAENGEYGNVGSITYTKTYNQETNDYMYNIIG